MSALILAWWPVIVSIVAAVGWLVVFVQNRRIRALRRQTLDLPDGSKLPLGSLIDDVKFLNDKDLLAELEAALIKRHRLFAWEQVEAIVDQILKGKIVKQSMTNNGTHWLLQVRFRTEDGNVRESVVYLPRAPLAARKDADR